MKKTEIYIQGSVTVPGEISEKQTRRNAKALKRAWYIFLLLSGNTRRKSYYTMKYLAAGPYSHVR